MGERGQTYVRSPDNEESSVVYGFMEHYGNP